MFLVFMNLNGFWCMIVYRENIWKENIIFWEILKQIVVSVMDSMIMNMVTIACPYAPKQAKTCSKHIKND